MFKIFISYRREDSEAHAGRIYDRLVAHFDQDSVFMDIDAIPIGVDFREHLDRAVGQCDVVLAVIGDHWLGVCFKEGPKQGQRRLEDPTDFIRIELASALDRDIPVIPVLVGKASIPSETDLPDCLKKLAYRNAAEVRSGRDFRDHVSRLIRGIEHLRKAKEEKEAERKRPIITGSQDTTGKIWGDPKPGEIITNSLGMKFAWIPPGTFLMGSPKDEAESSDVETQHSVMLSRGFYIGVHLVTQEQWQAAIGTNPSHFKGEKNLPIERVSWNDCQEFIKEMRSKDKNAYRLPTEAEWEYACRAGTRTPFCFGETISTDQANYNGDIDGTGTNGVYRRKTTPVGSFPANAWGLCDMHGNLWEWCQDRYGDYPRNEAVDPQGPENGERRVLRGGSWFDDPQFCRSAYRGTEQPGSGNSHCGFRLCFFPE